MRVIKGHAIIMMLVGEEPGDEAILPRSLYGLKCPYNYACTICISRADLWGYEATLMLRICWSLGRSVCVCVWSNSTLVIVHWVTPEGHS